MTTRLPILFREQSPPYRSLERLQQEKDSENAKGLFTHLSRIAYEGTPLGVCRPILDQDQLDYKKLLAIFLRNLQEQLAALPGGSFYQRDLEEIFRNSPNNPNHFLGLANTAQEIVEGYVFYEFMKQNRGREHDCTLVLDKCDPPLPFIPIPLDKLETLIEPLGRFRSLTELDLHENSLTELPHQLFDLHLLTTLNVSSNRIDFISGEIQRLTRLKEADFSDNQIRVVPSAFENLTELRVLNLYNNLITEFRVDIEYLKSLENLSLNANQLKSIRLGRAPRLKNLSLNINPLTVVQGIHLLPRDCGIGLRRTLLDRAQFSDQLKIRKWRLDITKEEIPPPVPPIRDLI